MPKYLAHYLPSDSAEDIRAVIEAPSYRAALAELRHAHNGVTVYSIKPTTLAEVEATPITARVTNA